MGKLNKRFSFLSILTVLCLCLALAFYGLIINQDDSKNIGTNNVQSASASEDALLADGQVKGGSANYKINQNYAGNSATWTRITNESQLRDWISNQNGKNAYLDNDINNFAWSSSDAGSTEIAAGLKLDGCGYTITMTKSTGWTNSSTVNSGLFAYRLYGDVINTNFVYTGDTSLNKGDWVDNYRIGIIFSIINGNFINNSVTIRGTYKYHTDTAGANGWSHGTMGIIAGLSYGTIKNTTVTLDGGTVDLHFKNGWLVGINSSIYMSAFVGLTQESAAIINCTYNRISGTMSCSANAGARYGTAIGNQTGSSRVDGFIYKNSGNFKDGLTTNGDTGYITAVKGGGTIENIYSTKALTGAWVVGNSENNGTYNYLSDANRFDIAFDKTNDNNLILKDKNNNGQIFWSLSYNNRLLSGYDKLYENYSVGNISIPKFASSTVNNNSGTVFGIEMGTLGTAEVGYNGESKVFDGKTISIINPQGLSLSGDLNPRNTGNYTLTVNEVSSGIAKLDTTNRVIIPTANVTKGIMSLTISAKPITIGLAPVNGLIYNGEEQIGIVTDVQGLIDGEPLNLNWNNSDKSTNAGSNVAIVASYNTNYTITDSTVAEYVIAQLEVNPIWPETLNYKANGSVQIPSVTWEGAIQKDLAGSFNVATDGGLTASYNAYNATASILNTANYKLKEGAVTSVEYYINFLTVSAISINQYGTVSVDKTDVDYNEIVTLSITNKFGYDVSEILKNNVISEIGAVSFYITEDTEFVVTFAPKNVNVNINSVNGRVDIDGEVKYNNTVTLTATPDSGYEFLNWTTSTGVVLGNSIDYSFIVINELDITANFVAGTPDGIVYTFLSFNGRIMKNIYAQSDLDINSVEADTVPGLTFVNWSAVEGKANTYKGNYIIDESATVKNVNVINGETITGETAYTYNSVVTVRPVGSGMFKYWMDANGQIVSYKSEYKFAILSNVTLTAVFDTEDVNSNIIALGNIQDNDSKWTISASFELVNGYILVETGLIVTDNATIAGSTDTFVLGAQDVRFAKSNKISLYNQFMLNVNKSVFTNTMFARAYLIVNNGEENIILYSDAILNVADAV